MTCLHGLNENNCPMCRISTSTKPNTVINTDSLKKNVLKAENPYYSDHIRKQEDFDAFIDNSENMMKPNLIGMIPVPNLINKMPTFENQIFSEKRVGLNLEHIDKLGITKKVELGSPNLDIDKE